MNQPVGILPMLQRQAAAADRFVDAVREQFGLPERAARAALQALLRAKLIKLDPIVGQFQLRDGRAWSADVMQRAAAQELLA